MAASSVMCTCSSPKAHNGFVPKSPQREGLDREHSTAQHPVGNCFGENGQLAAVCVLPAPKEEIIAYSQLALEHCTQTESTSIYGEADVERSHLRICGASTSRRGRGAVASR